MVSPNSIPTEIMYNILSFLPYPEVYRLRRVSRTFQSMAEHHIYQQIRSQGHMVSIKLGEKGKTSIELEAVSYDAVNKVIEFKPATKAKTIALSENTSTKNSKATNGSCSWSSYHRLFQVHFSQWRDNQIKKDVNLTQCLNDKEQAMYAYHESYNPAMEKGYELPCWNRFNEPKEHYVGDKGMVFHFEYVDPSSASKSYEEILLSNPYSGYQSVINSPAPSPPLMQVNFLRVTFEWLLTGMKSMVPTHQIYQDSYNKLDAMLQHEGKHYCVKYNPYSETILDYIMKDNENIKMNKKQLLQYVYSHSHECHTRLSRLEHMLEGAGVDPHVLWKYTFARLFVVGSGSLIGEEYIVRRIQDAEEEWRQQKRSFSRRLPTVAV